MELSVNKMSLPTCTNRPLANIKADKFKNSDDSLTLNFDKPRMLIEIVHNKQREYDLKYPSISNASTSEEMHIKPTKMSISQRLTSWLREMFLPVGYPQSVHRCYAQVHIFQFIETCAASTVSVITTESLLSAVGVSSEVDRGGAAAIQWVITNGFGELGKLVVIQQYSYLFDSYPKTSKLIGEVCCIAGNGLHILTHFAPQFYLPLASFGYVLYGIYLSIWGATHTTFNSHLALKDNNMGDLNAKDDAQVSLAHLLGLSFGITLLSYSNSPYYLAFLYILLSMTQVVMTLSLVRSANYEIMNFARMRLVAHALVHRNRTLSCLNLKGRENWIGEFITLEGLPRIILATGVADAMRDERIAERLNIIKVITFIYVIND